MEKTEINKTAEIIRDSGHTETIKRFAKIAAIGWIVKAAIITVLYFSVPEVRDVINMIKDKVMETAGFADEN